MSADNPSVAPPPPRSSLSRAAVTAVVVAVASTAVTAAFLVVAWRVTGERGAIFSLVSNVVLMAWSAVVGVPRTGLTASWFRVHAWEPRVYRALGVRIFDRILSVSGWNRLIEAERAFDGSRAGLAALDHDTRRSEVAHLACIAVVMVVTVFAVVAGLWTSAAWLLGLAIPLHLYPVGLQRLLRSRIDHIGDMEARAMNP